MSFIYALCSALFCRYGCEDTLALSCCSPGLKPGSIHLLSCCKYHYGVPLPPFLNTLQQSSFAQHLLLKLYLYILFFSASLHRSIFGVTCSGLLLLLNLISLSNTSTLSPLIAFQFFTSFSCCCCRLHIKKSNFIFLHSTCLKGLFFSRRRY